MGALSDRAIREQYVALKKNYVGSGLCHLYASYPPNEQAAFFAWLLKYELEALGGGNPNLSREQALENIGAYLGWSDAKIRNWKSDRGDVLRQRGQLLREIHATIARPDSREKFFSAMLPRVKWHFDRIGVRDCGDFIPYEVFAEAMKSRSRHLDRISPAKRNLLTILDRSQPLSDRRMIVMDLGKNQVLLHTVAGFGDGKVGGAAANESKRCSNQPGSGLSPEGPAMTTRIGKAGNGSFRGDGIFLETPSENGEWSSSRGLAIHAMSAYSALNLKAEQGGITGYYDRVIRGDASRAAMDGFLHTPVSPAEVRVPATDGCVGVPDETLLQVKSILSGGEFVYFYCPR
jgi:hypothetical protein